MLLLNTSAGSCLDAPFAGSSSVFSGFSGFTKVTDGCHPLAISEEGEEEEDELAVAVVSANTHKAKKQSVASISVAQSSFNSFVKPFSNFMKKTSDSLYLATSAIHTSTIPFTAATTTTTLSVQNDHFNFKEFSTFTPSPCSSSPLPDVELQTFKIHNTARPKTTHHKSNPLYASTTASASASGSGSAPGSCRASSRRSKHNHNHNHHRYPKYNSEFLRLAALDNSFYCADFPQITPAALNRLYLGYRELGLYTSIHQFMTRFKKLEFDGSLDFDDFCDVLEVGLVLKDRVWRGFTKLAEEVENGNGNESDGRSGCCGCYVDRYGRMTSEYLPWCRAEDCTQRDRSGFKPCGVLSNDVQYTVKGWSNKRWVGKTADDYE
ncbi:unnamed protein product [Ambrosiozyma monospora]|uniref:Unnamed protein product n=1 Tax=Ambrosiozyma monospora TaxID=43982 RepID=A0A9W6Z1X5_AMBMO|nr:unnamed protein product [Ambrosiozyma monospora]